MSDPRFDLDLKKTDILDLASPDALAAFFARLRYDTATRTVHSAGSLGISEAIARPIRRIELLAARDDLQIYLVELPSVTLASTRNLVRAFRDRSGDFLFVLTSGDYSRLDFVLVDRLPDAETPTTIASPTVHVRPRILTVERRNPAPLSLRVLRRFTWTEADRFAQVDKIRSAYSLAEWSEEEGLFNNRALFSDHYLKSRLQEEPAWGDDRFTSTGRELRDLLLERSGGGKVDETSLRSGFFEPAFRALGFHARTVRRDPNDVENPDYELLGPDAEKALALCLTYPWMRYLDGKDAVRDPDTPDENPGAVVVSLLQKRDVPWVVVTNGKLWRLYSKRTHSRATSFFEVDLEEVIAAAAASDSNPLRYFWLLFRREAFEEVTFAREGREERLPFLDRILLESEDYAKELGDRLKERIFDRVFPHLAAGFVAQWDEQPDEEELAQTYRATLTLLYRLLFLLYAEARDLLPVREVRGYYEKSLTRLKKEIAEAAGPLEDLVEQKLEKTFERDSTGLYERLSELFDVISKGNADLNVPFYNGGLFASSPADEDDSDEAEAARFLRDHAVPDRHLAVALDLLSREDDPRYGRIFIDYKSLGVRHLGSIYEGLLEFRLRFASERLGIVKEKGRFVYKSWRELDERKKARLERDGLFVKRGELHLENDKRERKATGSYYTPDYIVKYIVEHAVGPVVKEKLDSLRPRLREAEAWHRKQLDLARAKREKPTKYEYGPAVETHWRKLVDEIFDIKVLDPAMGSGHFLVEAVDFITDHVIDFLNAFPWNPVTAHLRFTREQILDSMEKQKVSIDPAKLTDVNLLKRHVLKRCIYGVDLNPMAVELAKVSLWLDCFTLGAPLSFLDHHLRCGNSLIGVTVEEVDAKLREGTQTLLFSGNRFAGVKSSVAGMIAIGELPDITPDQIQSSKSEYKRATSATVWARRLLDVYTSQWFGNEPTRTRTGEVNPVLEFLGDKASEAWAGHHGTGRLLPRYKQVVETALGASHEQRFFHWQLEFPEVFLASSTGFDAVIGNPPYDVLEKDRGEDTAPHELLLAFVRSHGSYAAATGGKLNLYRPFIVRSVGLTRKTGRYSQIVPMSLMGDISVARLRQTLLDEHSIERIAAFPQKDDERRRVFREAKLSACVPVVVCHDPDAATITLIEAYPWNSFDDEPTTCRPSRPAIRAIDPICVPLPLCSDAELELALQLHKNSRRIADVARVTRGEVNQTIFRQYISSDSKHRPLLKGAELRPFGFNVDLSQGEREYFDERLYERAHTAMRPPPDRIATQRISGVDDSRRLTCAISGNGAYFADSTNAIVSLDESDAELLVAVLNSRLINWRFRISSTNNNVGTGELEMLPFPRTIDPRIKIEIKGLVGQLSAAARESADLPPKLVEALEALVCEAYGVALPR
ncbi:MAG: Eco57I restriction-modification methylase domain-containing protein [Thermoanaerobaculia bacterium]